ncbi:MAG TPA: nucleotide exchange factor GrpE [Clostridiaceae bacterium]|nr:nucleotide exchange factor GrpE [Clostridiaceae bacterium]
MFDRSIKTLIFIIDQIDVMHKFALTTQNESLATSTSNVLKIITKSINEIGLVEIPSLGEIFNEEVHNCIKAVKCPEKRHHEIVEVLKKGYRLNGEVIRPADVIAVE